jgi:hypothetical protein
MGIVGFVLKVKLAEHLADLTRKYNKINSTQNKKMNT